MQIDQNIFYEEFLDKISSLDETLSEIENDFTDRENLNSIFRAIHTVKGTSDLLGMFNVVAVTHKAEDLLDEFRNGKAVMDFNILELYKELKDYLKLCIENTANGVYDDPTTQNLEIYFEKEFSRYLQMMKDGVFELSAKTVLIVENTSITRYMIKKVASKEGFSSFMCDNGFDAVQKIKDNDIDLIFCDISSDCEQCKEFLLQVSSDLLYDHIPIVVLVDCLTEDMRSFAQKIKAKAWLKKPIEMNKLTIILNKLLGK